MIRIKSNDREKAIFSRRKFSWFGKFSSIESLISLITERELFSTFAISLLSANSIWIFIFIRELNEVESLCDKIKFRKWAIHHLSFDFLKGTVFRIEDQKLIWVEQLKIGLFSESSLKLEEKYTKLLILKGNNEKLFNKRKTRD